MKVLLLLILLCSYVVVWVYNLPCVNCFQGVQHRVLYNPVGTIRLQKLKHLASTSNKPTESNSTILNNPDPIIVSENKMSMIPVCEYHTVQIPTTDTGPPRQAISTEDLTPILHKMLQESGITNGFVTIISRHTTTAITINEHERRLVKDMEEFFLKRLVPPDERSESNYSVQGIRYYHNDIHLRPDSEEEKQRCIDNGWNIIDNVDELKRWRQQEPINAHSHLLSMLLGSSECIPIQNNQLVLGQWQSVLLVDLDGPRDRTVGIQFMGFR